MSAVNRRYDDEYERDEDMIDEEQEEYEDEDTSLFGLIKNKLKSWFDYNYYGKDADDEDAGEEYDGEEEERQTRASRASAQRKRVSSRRSYEPEDDAVEERRTRSGSASDSSSYTQEELKELNLKYGTRYAPMREERRKQVRQRMDPGASERRATASSQRKTTSAAAWESYRGNVKRIAEMTPRTMDNIEEIASMLMDDYAAIINLANMKNSKVNAISYLDGVSFVIGYRFEYIGEEYYICAPAGYMISHEFGTYRSRNNR